MSEPESFKAKVARMFGCDEDDLVTHEVTFTVKDPRRSGPATEEPRGDEHEYVADPRNEKQCKTCKLPWFHPNHGPLLQPHEVRSEA